MPKALLLTVKKCFERDATAHDIETPTRDVTAPSITKVTSASGRYKVGDTIEIAIKFNEVILVDGNPALKLDINGVIRTALMFVVHTDTLVFNYTIASGDTTNDLNTLGANALRVDGVKITDISGNVANVSVLTSVTNLASTSDVKIDTTPPGSTITSMTYTASNDTLVTILSSTKCYQHWQRSNRTAYTSYEMCDRIDWTKLYRKRVKNVAISADDIKTITYLNNKLTLVMKSAWGQF